MAILFDSLLLGLKLVVGVELVVDAVAVDKGVDQTMTCALEIGTHAFQHSRGIACCFAFLVGYAYFDDVARGELAGEELRIAFRSFFFRFRLRAYASTITLRNAIDAQCVQFA